MHELRQILGEPVTSPAVAAVIERYALTAETPDPDTPDRVTYANPSAGLQLQHGADERVTTVFIHAEGKDGYTQFADPLPGGLSFDHTRDDVRAVLGTPSRFKDPGVGLFVGPHGGWDRYDDDDASLHVEYRLDDGRIELITLMHPDEVPGGRG